jgi:hypothetical protein
MRTIVGSHKWGLVEDSATFFEKGIPLNDFTIPTYHTVFYQLIKLDMEKLKDKFATIATGPWLDEPCVMKVIFITYLCI